MRGPGAGHGDLRDRYTLKNYSWKGEFMPEIEIRAATAEDIPELAAIDHNYTTEFVWQMEIQVEEKRVGVTFHEVRLPRSVRVDYPRQVSSNLEDWASCSGVLVARLDQELVGYASLQLDIAPGTTWVTDLAVRRRARRQGIGSAILLAAQEWGSTHNTRYLTLEMQPKNYPAILMARKLGFDFCGYNDRYYTNRDIALFFTKSLR
jgi:ribosomal protein S18 acetylase RimI-like enzyme